MRNIENFGVQEMSIVEQKNVDGGGFWLALLAVSFVAGIVAGLWDKSDSCQTN